MERSSRQKEQYNASAKQKEKKQTVSHGKQSLKKLAENGAQLSNIEVTDGNIKSFARCARKYNIDYSLKKDRSVSPPRYFVFFRAKDVDSITANSGKAPLLSLQKSFRHSGGTAMPVYLPDKIQ